MALLTARRQAPVEIAPVEPASLTQSVDAALGFVRGSRYLPTELVEDILFALGLQAEAECAPAEACGVVAAAIATLPETGRVPVGVVVDTLLDLRIAAGRPDLAGLRA